jgi:hypothetical protein
MFAMSTIPTKPLSQAQITIKYLHNNTVQFKRITLAVRDADELDTFITDAKTYTAELIDITTRLLIAGVN